MVNVMFSALLLYSIKSAMVLTMLYLPYMLMLRHESFFRFNRLMLLGILLLSLTLPLCNVPWMSLDHQPVVQAAQLQMLELGIPVHVLPEVQVIAENQESSSFFTFSLFHLFTFIYIIGMVLLLVMRLWQIGRLQFGLRRGVLWKQEEQDIRIYCHAENVAPFSWMHNIVISQQDFDEAGREIILHETGHIQNHHSWDVVLLTLVQMLQWWNPLAYVLGISLRDVHEYEADDFVLRQGVSAQAYQLLLIRKAVGSGTYAFANNFNHSLTKKRITMMKKIKSNPWMRGKALYVIPVAALALCAFATPKFVAPIENAVTELEGKDAEVSTNLQTSEEKRKVVEMDNLSKVVVDGKEMTPREAMEAVKGKEIENNLITQPDGSKALSIKTRGHNGAQPLIVLNGKIYEIPKGVKDITKEEQLMKLLNIDAEDIESITVLQKDAAVATWGDKGSNGVIVIKTKKTEANKAKEDSIYNVVAHNASYPGGDTECFKFISENIRYPKLCQEFRVQGRVIISFVVEKDGSISDIMKVRGPDMVLSKEQVEAYKKEHPDSQEQLKAGDDLGELLYAEAARVLKMMPKWEPAKDKEDNIVRCHFNLPVMFRLK